MNIAKCITKIYPDWQGSIRDNVYEGIRPHELETRPIPTREELEVVWAQVQAEMEIEDTHFKGFEANICDAKNLSELKVAIRDILKYKGLL